MIGLGATSDLFVFYRGKSREEANIKKVTALLESILEEVHLHQMPHAGSLSNKCK